jgi:hypothetical protein
MLGSVLTQNPVASLILCTITIGIDETFMTTVTFQISPKSKNIYQRIHFLGEPCLEEMALGDDRVMAVMVEGRGAT